MSGNLQEEIVQHALGLCRISGQFAETQDVAILLEAKCIAQKIAAALAMPEAAMLLTAPSGKNIPVTMRKFAWSVGKIAKVCEALDHFEEFSYRETLEKNVRIILRL